VVGVFEQVTIYLGAGSQEDDFAFELELVPQGSRPQFSADLSGDFSANGAVAGKPLHGSVVIEDGIYLLNSHGPGHDRPGLFDR
jgi:hypothetical protein